MSWQKLITGARSGHRRLRYGRFAFSPNLTPNGMPGPVPKIEEAPVDFGFHFTRQIRVARMTADTVTLEKLYDDGTNSSHATPETYNWKPNGTLVRKITGAWRSAGGFRSRSECRTDDVLEPAR